MIVRNKLVQLLLIGLLVHSISVFSSEHPELKVFPAPKEGMERFVIVLPYKALGEDDSFLHHQHQDGISGGRSHGEDLYGRQSPSGSIQ